LNRYSVKETGRWLIVEKLIIDRQKSKPLHPSTVVSCAVEDSMNVQRFASDREEDPIWKTVREDTPNVCVAMNDAKHVGIVCRSMERSQYLVEQFCAETRSVRLIPRSGINNIFDRRWADDGSPNHRGLSRCRTVVFSCSVGIPESGLA
jgi:hypothetical protein